MQLAPLLLFLGLAVSQNLLNESDAVFETAVWNGPSAEFAQMTLTITKPLQINVAYQIVENDNTNSLTVTLDESPMDESQWKRFHNFLQKSLGSVGREDASVMSFAHNLGCTDSDPSECLSYLSQSPEVSVALMVSSLIHQFSDPNDSDSDEESDFEPVQAETRNVDSDRWPKVHLQADKFEALEQKISPELLENAGFLHNLESLIELYSDHTHDLSKRISSMLATVSESDVSKTSVMENFQSEVKSHDLVAEMDAHTFVRDKHRIMSEPESEPESDHETDFESDSEASDSQEEPANSVLFHNVRDWFRNKSLHVIHNQDERSVSGAGQLKSSALLLTLAFGSSLI